MFFFLWGDIIKNKTLKFILGSSIGLITIFLIVLIPVLMVLDFFGANVTDNYVENNSEYSENYKRQWTH